MVFQHELDTVNPSLLNKYIFVKTDCSNESHVCIQRRIENIARGTTDPEIDSVTCISCKFGNQMLPLVLVANLTTRWHHLHQLQICPPDGTTCISCTIDHQMAPLVFISCIFISCIFGHQVAQFGLVWSSGGTRHQ